MSTQPLIKKMGAPAPAAAPAQQSTLLTTVRNIANVVLPLLPGILTTTVSLIGTMTLGSIAIMGKTLSFAGSKINTKVKKAAPPAAAGQPLAPSSPLSHAADALKRMGSMTSTAVASIAKIDVKTVGACAGAYLGYNYIPSFAASLASPLFNTYVRAVLYPISYVPSVVSSVSEVAFGSLAYYIVGTALAPLAYTPSLISSVIEWIPPGALVGGIAGYAAVKKLLS